MQPMQPSNFVRIMCHTIWAWIFMTHLSFNGIAFLLPAWFLLLNLVTTFTQVLIFTFFTFFFRSILQIEPICNIYFSGLYIPADCKGVPQEFRGVGIRIEDDVLYTKNGVDVLTKDCTKEVNDLKKLLSKWFHVQRSHSLTISIEHIKHIFSMVRKCLRICFILQWLESMTWEPATHKISHRTRHGLSSVKPCS